MEESNQIIAFTIIALATISVFSAPVAMAAYLKIKIPDTGAKVPAGQFLNVIGTSNPSNATRTHCTVSLQTNQHGYQPVTPLGPQGTYTNWQGKSSEPIKIGINQIEGQFQCFAAGTNTPNFTKHLVHNITGIATTTTGTSNMSLLNTTAG
jgi:hypothetical protein